MKKKEPAQQLDTKLWIIGLTGGIASGKTTVSDLFAKLSVDIVDTDIISHHLMQPQQIGYSQTVRHFGSAILRDSGEINRAALKSIIFSDPEQKQWLEQMLHPLIYQKAVQQINDTNASTYVLLVVPLLFESDFGQLCDKTLVIDCHPEVQMQRLIQRDNISKLLAEKIIPSQLSNQARLQQADYVIDNNKSDSDLIRQVDKLNQLFSKLPAKS